MSASLALLAAAGIGAACRGRDGWTDPAPPVHVFANVYDVGTCGITVLLVTTPEGHVLIDAGPKDAVPVVEANIKRLGFKLRDVRYLLSGHEHADHAGGFATLQWHTRAPVLTRIVSRTAMMSGRADPRDPQAGALPFFRPPRTVRVVSDGARLPIGGTIFTAHATPGHSPGATSWTWQSCAGKVCRRFAYADSLSAVSAKAYRFRDHPAVVATLRRSIATVAALPCDILITPHPGASNLFARLDGKAPLVNPAGCRTYAAAATKALAARLASEDKKR